MAMNSSSGISSFSPPPPWVCTLLGIVLIGAGILVLGDVVVATLISAMFIGVVAIIAGAFEIVHAFWTKGWGGFAWQIILGILYIAFGFMLVSQPVAGALALTYVLGLLLVVSGIVRIAIGIKHLKNSDWTMLISGILGLVAGLVILTGWPITGLKVLGFLLGIDLVVHGIAWLVYAFRPSLRRA